MNNRLCVYYQNCCGLRTKLHTLYMNILSHSYDIVVLTETWFNETITEQEYIDGRYRVFRCDRDRVRCGRKDGGGVLIAVRRELGAELLIVPYSPPPPPPTQSPINYAIIDHVLITLPEVAAPGTVGARATCPQLHTKRILLSAAYPRIRHLLFMTITSTFWSTPWKHAHGRIFLLLVITTYPMLSGTHWGRPY